jgi:hypothetical protein
MLLSQLIKWANGHDGSKMIVFRILVHFYSSMSFIWRRKVCNFYTEPASLRIYDAPFLTHARGRVNITIFVIFAIFAKRTHCKKGHNSGNSSLKEPK